MTKISQINGLTPPPHLPTSGVVQDYVPYTGLTEGELRLWLYRNQALTLRQLYPEYKEYQKAYDMLGNALHNNVSAGVQFVGAIPDELQMVARAIDQASRQTAPASRGGLISRIGPSAIGDIVQTNIPDANCEQYATRTTNLELKAKFKIELSTTNWKRLKGGKFIPGTLLLNLSKNFSPAKWYQKWEDNRLKCENQRAIEGILNGFVTEGSHHVLYKEMPNESYVPNLVRAKTVNHQGGVAGLATTGGMKTDLMQLWTETAIQAKNASINVGALNSLQSSATLAPDPEKFNALLVKTLEQKGKTRGGIGVIDPITVTLITAAITASVTVATTLINALFKKENYAMSAAQGTGFGTAAYTADKKDFIESGSGNGSTTGGNNNMLPLILGGAGLYLLSQD
jgi:hypothetical protein